MVANVTLQTRTKTSEKQLYFTASSSDPLVMANNNNTITITIHTSGLKKIVDFRIPDPSLFAKQKKNARNFEGVFGGAWCIYGAMVDLDTMQDGKGGNPWRSQAEADMGVGTVLVSQACWPAMWLDPWHVGKWNHYIHHTNGGRMRNTYSIWFLLVVWRTNFQHCFQDNKW